jgi:hypothetical protein
VLRASLPVSDAGTEGSAEEPLAEPDDVSDDEEVDVPDEPPVDTPVEVSPDEPVVEPPTEPVDDPLSLPVEPLDEEPVPVLPPSPEDGGAGACVPAEPPPALPVAVAVVELLLC